VITDEAGTPVHPEWYSDEFGRLLRRAGLRRITLHDSRHTALTLMKHASVPISIISKLVRPGEFGGRYVCELLISLPVSSA
jgi:integrase